MLNVNLPLNSLSFGQTSICILKEMYKRNLKINLFPIGQPQLESYRIEQDFANWLQNAINRAPAKYNRKFPSFKLWHANEGWLKISDNQGLMSFIEVDNLSEYEVNIYNNQDVVFVTNNWSKQIFDDYGVKNCKVAHLGFDSETFYETNATYLDNDITVWSLVGKCEMRKNTLRLLNIWSKMFGNNRNHRLNCLIYNPFLKPEQNQQQLSAALENKPFYNITFLPPLKTNAEVNDFFNCTDIAINVSGGEGADLPAIQHLGLGKTVVGTDCHAHKDFLNESNSIIVKNCGKIPARDGQFFIEGQSYNQGNFFNFSNDAIVDGFERAAKSIIIDNNKKKSIYYTKAKKIVDTFNYKNTVDVLLDNLV